MVATIDEPVHAYLTAHSAGLPLPVTALYLLWVTSGSVLLITAYRRVLNPDKLVRV